MKNDNYDLQCDALRAFIREALDVLGHFHPDLWLFFRRESPVTAEDILNKAKHHSGKTQFIFLTDRGLWLYFRLSKSGTFKAWVGGWGSQAVPETFLVLTMLLNKHGFLPEEYLSGNVAPFTASWLFDHGYELENSIWLWSRENSDLIPNLS